MNKIVSVIIPAYNASKTIEQTLVSVFEQTYEDIEIIVVNDGSIDQTLEILEKYTNKINMISTSNKGVSHARNLGLLHAKGFYIQYLDSDDLLMPDKLSVQVNALNTSNADVAYGDWQKFIQNSTEIKLLEKIERQISGDIEIALFTDFWCPPAALLYTKKITDQLSWNENLPVIQDARYLLDSALAKGKFIYTPGIMARYRTAQEKSLSQKSEAAFVRDCFENAKEVYQIWAATTKFDQAKKSAVIGVLRYCINRFSVFDHQLANKAIDLLLHIAPKYIPEQRSLLRSLSKIFGYRNAEKIAGLKRHLIK
ncbi:glycosyltransferase [Pedobacter chinensis]|uniref:Glycosyltransferase n=1 Tax=Pedobacter chinensis TaxID=2282421 RepID=A0A369PZ11_9SPHI|nr:glycosyltransferase [Pedobacter chinensis]RDC56217.1 glycosyltransferase [Pedobacter chinensis]